MSLEYPHSPLTCQFRRETSVFGMGRALKSTETHILILVWFGFD